MTGAHAWRYRVISRGVYAVCGRSLSAVAGRLNRTACAENPTEVPLHGSDSNRMMGTSGC
jgi:hypothetical protein